MRNDGTLECYLIKHVHPNTLKEGWDGKTWAGSGDCDQFALRGRNSALFAPFRASGQVWQEYGIYGTYDLNEAIHAVVEMQRVYPEYLWAVFKLEITQRNKLLMRTYNDKSPK